MRPISSPKGGSCSTHFLLLGLLIAVLPISAHSQTATTITLNPSSLGRTIPSTFSGVSIETYSALDLGTTKYPSTNGPANVQADAWFVGGSSANASQKLFGTVMQTIGVKSMRFGGTTCEKPTYLVSGGGSNPNAIYPPLYDEEYVASFAQQYGMQLIWCIPAEKLYNVNTYDTYIADAVAAQKAAGQNFPFVVEVSNESDDAGMSSSIYNSEFDAYLGAMRKDANTSIQFEGPDGGGSGLVAGLLADPNYDSTSAPWHGNITDISRHTYIGSQSNQSSVNGAITTMLESQSSRLQSEWTSFGPQANKLNYDTRLSELNSYSGGGYNGASNAFAAGLWGLDLMEYYSHNTNLTGVNFHVGASGQFYSPFMPQNLSSSYTLQGLGYGMLAFNTDGMGKVVPTTISGNGSSLNLTAYGTSLSDGSETAIVINKTSVIAGTNTNVTLTVDPGKSYTTAAVYYLHAPNNDPTQTSGVTFGGAQMSSTSGTWSGSPTFISANSNGTFTIPLSYTEAAVIHMSSSSGSNQIPNGTYTVTSVSSGLAIDDPGSSGTAGKDMQMYTLNSGANQQWKVDNISTNVITLTNVSSGQLLEVAGASKSGAALIDQEPANGQTNQQWNVISLGNGAYELTNVNSGLALDIAGGGTGPGIDQWTYQGDSWQQWKFNTP
jgi:hypothetical protein